MWRLAVPRSVMGVPLSNPYGEGLGALTPDQAAQQAMPTSAISSTPGFTQTVYNDILQAAQSGQFVGFDSAGCTGVQSGTPAILAVAGGLALKFAGAAGPAAPIVMAIGGALEIFSAVFAHHSAKVAMEQKVVCAAVPAANDSLAAIQQAVQNGTLTPQQGIASVQQLLSSFTSTVAGIMKNSPSQCNAACVWVKELTAIVAYQSSIYQDQIAAAAANPASSILPASVTAPITGAVASVAASTGIPTWLFWLGGALLLWEAL